MTESIETRELIVLDGYDSAIRGTYHKVYDERASQGPSKVVRDRVGVVFLNSTSPTRAANGDAAVYLADSFAKMGHPSFRIDLPGFGDSEGEPVEDIVGFINRGGYASVASRSIGQLCARFYLSGVVIIGQCAGSVNALYTAAVCRECKGLVMIGPYFSLPKAEHSSKIRTDSDSGIREGQSGELSRKVCLPPREIPFSPAVTLPENANHLLLDKWERVASTRLPILIIKGPDRNASSNRPKARGEFDYMEHVLKLAGPKSNVDVRVTEGNSNAFMNRLGLSTIQQYTLEWLDACLPCTGIMECDRTTGHSEPGNE